MANDCTECDGSGYYGSWGRERICLACPTGRAKLLRLILTLYKDRPWKLTIAEKVALAIARAEASISVDTVSKRD